MAEERDLKSVLKAINKKYGENVAKTGVNDLTSFGTLSLGSPSFDFCLYNSFPERKIIEFNGAEGSGKTTTAYFVAASFQRKEMERNPTNPRKILFIDLECGADPHWAKMAGYDMNDHPVETIRFVPEDMSAEEIFDAVIDMIRTGEIGLIILDSLNMLVPQQIQGESMEKKSMGGIANVLGDFVRRVTSLLIKYNCTLIGINQLRENISGYGQAEITSGGRGWKHGCAVRMKFKKGDFFDEEGNVLNSTAESPAGYVLEAFVQKTKVCKWDRKLGRMHINYTTGVDILQDTIEVATHFGYIQSPAQGSFRIMDPDTGEVVCDEDGNEIKIRGKKNIKPYFQEHPEQWKRLYDKVYEKLSHKDDPSIVAFEKMLDIDLAEKFGVNPNEEDD